MNQHTRIRIDSGKPNSRNNFQRFDFRQLDLILQYRWTNIGTHWLRNLPKRTENVLRTFSRSVMPGVAVERTNMVVVLDVFRLIPKVIEIKWKKENDVSVLRDAASIRFLASWRPRPKKLESIHVYISNSDHAHRLRKMVAFWETDWHWKDSGSRRSHPTVTSLSAWRLFWKVNDKVKPPK